MQLPWWRCLDLGTQQDAPRKARPTSGLACATALPGFATSACQSSMVLADYGLWRLCGCVAGVQCAGLQSGCSELLSTTAGTGGVRLPYDSLCYMPLISVMYLQARGSCKSLLNDAFGDADHVVRAHLVMLIMSCERTW